jgi:hypothetical protein
MDTQMPLFPNVVIVGEAQSGRAAAALKAVESLIANMAHSTFDLAEHLFEVKSNQYYASLGHATFKEYTSTLEIKPRKAQYVVRMAEVMSIVGIPREQYEPVGIAKLREITSLTPEDIYVHPETKEEKPMGDFIRTFVETAHEMSLEQIKQLVKTLKGLDGENELIFVPFYIKKIVNEQTVQPALEKMKRQIGSVGRDEEGNAIDPSNGQALEAMSANCLASPDELL